MLLRFHAQYLEVDPKAQDRGHSSCSEQALISLPVEPQIGSHGKRNHDCKEDTNIRHFEHR